MMFISVDRTQNVSTVYTRVLTEFFTPHLEPQIVGSVNTRDIQNIGHRLSNLVDLRQLSKL